MKESYCLSCGELDDPPQALCRCRRKAIERIERKRRNVDGSMAILLSPGFGMIVSALIVWGFVELIKWIWEVF